VPVPSDDDAIATFQQRAGASAGGLQVEEVTPPSAAHYAPPAQPQGALERRHFNRDLDTAWRRTSYSALTSAAHDATSALASEPESPVKDDEEDAV
jgi:exodeoxyribonuclease V beta subunit